ncbi:hypothetical protein DPMN_111964 [Dreissena polymorpha]|uniref:Uncharacterized protein n=1 Tax=Dreissena polymorpha TaxID=45954 RepID=A0A9D4KG69_DREPO|nr:hypothetical protein DPMN_111964 [Dreissena polymorpha]
MVPGIEPRSEQSPFTRNERNVPGSNPKSMDHHSLLKRVLQDSKPGSDAYVASAHTGDGTLYPVDNKASAQGSIPGPIAYRDSAQTGARTRTHNSTSIRVLTVIKR